MAISDQNERKSTKWLRGRDTAGPKCYGDRYKQQQCAVRQSRQVTASPVWSAVVMFGTGASMRACVCLCVCVYVCAHTCV